MRSLKERNVPSWILVYKFIINHLNNFIMRGTRIMLALEKKLSCRQNDAKIKRLQKGIEVSLANAEEQVASAEDRLENFIQGFNVDTDIQTFLTDVSKALYEKDEAQSAIDQLKRIESHLFEELDVDDTPKE